MTLVLLKACTRRSPEKIAELILDAERKGNSAEIYRRELINPQQFSRWKSKAKEAIIQGLKGMNGVEEQGKQRRGRVATAEVEKLRAKLSDQTIELTLLKKA